MPFPHLCMSQGGNLHELKAYKIRWTWDGNVLTDDELWLIMINETINRYISTVWHILPQAMRKNTWKRPTLPPSH